MEQFKDLPEYEDLYSISNTGKVFSKRYSKYLKHDISKNNKIHSVRIVNYNGIVKRQSVIRLMAITFLDNPNPKLYNNAININGNHDDLRIDNIMWGTSSIHIKRKYNRYPHLLDKFIKSSSNLHTRKMTDDLELKMIEMYKLGYSSKQLEDIFPIKKAMIFRILKKHSTE
jgi:hypothetical protein